MIETNEKEEFSYVRYERSTWDSLNGLFEINFYFCIGEGESHKESRTTG
ncbi:MAG: hypothetical protein NTY07_17610 [Bacteroidia bacterium]|nr:hypothetical protein [Bacteroidia bacterium]